MNTERRTLQITPIYGHPKEPSFILGEYHTKYYFVHKLDLRIEKYFMLTWFFFY